MIVFDTTAMLAFLFEREGAGVVEAALIQHAGATYAHVANATEVFYQLHRRGALAACVARTPSAQNPTHPNDPNLGGADLLDPSVFDALAGDAIAKKGIASLEAVGIQWVEKLSRSQWEDAARLKSQWRRVSVADCFGLALAQELDCAFLTADHHELDALAASHIARIEWIR